MCTKEENFYVDTTTTTAAAAGGNSSEHSIIAVDNNNNNDDDNPCRAKFMDQEVHERFQTDGYVRLPRVIPVPMLKEWKQYSEDLFVRTFERLHENGHTMFPMHRRRCSRCCRHNSSNRLSSSMSSSSLSMRENGSVEENEEKVVQEQDGTTTGEKYEYALGLGGKNGFREVVMRSPGRYELSLLQSIDTTSSSIESESSSNNNNRVPSIQALKKYLSQIAFSLMETDSWDNIQLCNVSLVLSSPGAPNQSWHADGGHCSMETHLSAHCINLFVPLQDVNASMGPTEFKPGSHTYTRNLVPMLLSAMARKTLRPCAAPCLHTGDVLAFDYRILHRGKANNNRSKNNNNPSSNNKNNNNNNNNNKSK